MDFFPLQEFIQHNKLPITLAEFLQFFEQSSYQCIFVKNQQSQYVYANRNFIQLMGLKNLQQLRIASDLELSTDPMDAKKYRDMDCYVLEENRILEVSETLAPKKNQSIIKSMQGKLYPVLADNGDTNAVLGMVAPKSKLLKLDWDTIFQLTPAEMREILTKRSSKFELSWGVVSLSKMEILTLIQLLKGQHAGEIAESLHLKQSTVESYLGSIKNKLGVTHKSELIQLVMQENILQKVIL